MRLKTNPIVISCLLVAVRIAAAANPQGERPPPLPLMMLGPGVVISQKAQKSAPLEILPIPLFMVQWNRLRLFGPQLSYTLVRRGKAALEGVVKMRSEGYEAEEGPALRGMSDRNRTLEAGLAFQMNWDWATLGIDWSSDILQQHGGYELRGTLSRRLNDLGGIERLQVTPLVGVNRRSRPLNNYYYGVRADETAPDRPEYAAKSSWGLLAGIRVEKGLTQKWTLHAGLFGEWLNQEITKSPIVDKPYRLSGIAGAMYRF